MLKGQKGRAGVEAPLKVTRRGSRKPKQVRADRFARLTREESLTWSPAHFFVLKQTLSQTAGRFQQAGFGNVDDSDMFSSVMLRPALTFPLRCPRRSKGK